MEDKTLTAEQLQEKLAEEKKKAVRKSVAGLKTLSDYFDKDAEYAGITLPKVNGNGKVLVQRTTGLAMRNALTFSEETFYTVLWCIMNQSNSSVRRLSKEQLEEALWDFRESLDVSRDDEYLKAVLLSMGLTKEQIEQATASEDSEGDNPNQKAPESGA